MFYRKYVSFASNLKKLYIFVIIPIMNKQLELYETKFINESKNFISASQVLKESNKCGVENQMFLSQIIFMIRHACELILKGLHFKLLKNNTGVSDCCNIKLENIKGNNLNQTIFECHSLLMLYDSFTSMARFNLLLSRDRLLKFRNKVIKVDIIDKDSTYFRYPIDKNGNLNSRTYFIDPEDPDINPDFNDFSIDQIFIDEIDGCIKYINIVPEAIEYKNKLEELYCFLLETQESF